MFPEGKDNRKDKNLFAETLKKCGGGGLVDKFTNEELEKYFEGRGTPDKIQNTIKRLKEKKDWDEFEKDYEYGKLLSNFVVKPIIQDSLKKKEEEEKETAQKKEEEEEKEILEVLKKNIMNGSVTELNEVDYKKIRKGSGDGPRQFWENNWVLDKEIQKYKYKEKNPSNYVRGWKHPSNYVDGFEQGH